MLYPEVPSLSTAQLSGHYSGGGRLDDGGPPGAEEVPGGAGLLVGLGVGDGLPDGEGLGVGVGLPEAERLGAGVDG